ncbi:MAG: prepilin-type N-terminal cleavage/methylation domain-containing protein [Gammaproteobacteria bacterium]|nr:prepilin-type N-terminal cleavage/methylation domain-containing protein [Gammaproteobacteria bacterium]
MASRARSQRGASLIEVLVAMVILSVGLLSLVVLHGRLHLMQMESYQRSQALILLNDMASRIALNRNDAGDYVTDVPVGAGMACPADPADRQEADIVEWCSALQGAAETLSGGSVGAMVGGRGCVEDIGGGDYLVTVAWQGMSPVSAPPASVTCGANEYDGDAGTPCVNDLCRRVVTTVVRIATLT